VAVIPACLLEGIIFTRQSQIDTFQINYPNCTEIEGAVEINGDNITHLDSLIVLTSIVGFLRIHDNPALTRLSGLDSISAGSIDSLFIFNNDALYDCDIWPICQYLNVPGGQR